MAFQGGNLERKEIGLSIGVSGTHYNTEIDSVTGQLRLKALAHDANGEPIYAESGSWTSDVVDLEDNFNDFEKVFTTDTKNGASSFAVLTRVSDNGQTWSDWTPIAMDGTIQSDTKRYIQVRIDLFAGFVDDTVEIAKTDFDSAYISEFPYAVGDYVVPKLTSNTSHVSINGFAFSSSEYSSGYSAWNAFSKVDKNENFVTKSGVLDGFLGFCFIVPKKVSKYKVRSMAGSNYLKSMPNTWTFEGSNDTTNGTDGTWNVLDSQTEQSWGSVNTDKVYEIKNSNKYKAYRINFSRNNGHTSYTGIGALDFYESGTTTMQLKREYVYDMESDSTWADEGIVNRKKITREEWIRIDSLEVISDGD